MSSGDSPRPDSARQVRHGRGALSNRTGRFEARQHENFDDGWGTIEEETPRLSTSITPEQCRNPLSRNDSPDVPFERALNPYKGCEHGCVYCFARPTHAYLGLSPGLDFETRIFSKPDAPERLRAVFRKRGYAPRTIAVGANTDPYQPAERELRITRRVLEVMLEFQHPVSLITKSQLVLRDGDLLGELATQGLASVCVSLTTLDPQLARRMEPRATSPAGRVEIMRRLTGAGVPCHVLASPIIPGLNDMELEGILEAAAGAGGSGAATMLLRLPHELKELFEEWLREHYPQRADKVLGLIRASRDGELYRARFGERMTGTGPYAQVLARRFEIACRRLGLERRNMALSTSLFRVPPARGENLDLFEDKAQAGGATG